MNQKQKRIVGVGVAIVVAFLAGFLWQYARAAGLARQLEETRAELAVQRLQATLGAAAILAQRGDHEAARQLASRFFTESQAELANTPPAVRTELEAMQTQRDAVITSLARANPESGEVLTQQFMRLRQAAGGDTGSSPETEPAAAPDSGS